MRVSLKFLIDQSTALSEKESQAVAEVGGC